VKTEFFFSKVTLSLSFMQKAQKYEYTKKLKDMDINK
jgi:hypothetical protein